jgi:hypothetical protein
MLIHCISPLQEVRQKRGDQKLSDAGFQKASKTADFQQQNQPS